MRRCDAAGEDMAARVRHYLVDSRVAFEIVAATPDVDVACADHMAKATLLRDEDQGDFVLAVFPASHVVMPDKVSGLLGRRMTFASESDARELFPDCDSMALPPVGHRYGVEVVVDEGLGGLREVCFPCGTCQCFAQVSGADFARMMAAARKGAISTGSGGTDAVSQLCDPPCGAARPSLP